MPSDPVADERGLRMELMRADMDLKTKQAFWETPRNLAVLLGVVAAVAGLLGYEFGQMAQPAPIVINLPPQPAAR